MNQKIKCVPGIVPGLFLLLSLIPMNSIAQDSTLRHPAAGPVSGQVEENGALSWRGIPYATPPVGALRWKASRPAEKHDEVLAATSFGSYCTQMGQPMMDVDPSLYGKAVGSEDCLFLNIWAPAGAGDGLAELPVMVWLHGGSNVGGSGSYYNASFLAAQQNVIVVTVNYRLGLLGWFSHPALREAAETPLDKSPNFGTLDTILALKWVRDNIAAFGGDAANVTLFGESAGAMNTMTLLYSPLASGLFHKAIMQSGSLRQTPIEVAEQHTPDDRSEFSSSETAAKLLLNRGEAASREQAREQVAKLSHEAFTALVYSASGEELVATYTPDIAAAIRVPQIIPDDIVVPKGQPWELIAEAGRVHPVPILLGSNRDEMKFFMGLNPAYVTIVPGKEIRIHDLDRYNLHARYLSDRWTALGVDEIALRLKENNPDIYAYRFDWDEQPSYPQADFKQFFGAGHAMELPFLFNDFAGFEVFALHFTEQNRAGREQLASEMGEYWANFAWTGEPGRGRSGTLPLWPRWGEGNKLMLDAAPSGGKLHAGVLTMKSLHRRFAGDDSFASAEEKTAFSQAMFGGREAWEDYFSRFYGTQ
jgi:para-nitrobenzyl esterase